jgi:glucose/mannose-6-phosphate isomerase
MKSRPENARWGDLYRTDRSGMLAVLQRFPDQCREGLVLGGRVPAERLAGFSRIVTVGMGGSGIAGSLLAALLPAEVVSVRGYTVPRWVGEESLVVALSYSGDTEETLSAFHDALPRTRRLLAVTSGGALGALCAEQGISWIKIPSGYQPRAALGYLLFPLLGLFGRLGLIGGLEGVFSVLDEVAHEAAPGEGENEAQRLARALHGRVPLIYGAGPTAPVALRWKTQVNENAKQPAFCAEIPELCHNEVVGWELSGKILPQGSIVFLRSRHDHPRVRARVEILQQLLSERELPWLEVHGRGESVLAQMLSLLFLGDWVSAYLALANGMDPTPVEIIRDLKDRLAGQGSSPSP